LSKQNDPLVRLSRSIDFEFFRKSLFVFPDADSNPSKGGKLCYDEVLMFKTGI
jgi:hypothetical protein